MERLVAALSRRETFVLIVLRAPEPIDIRPDGEPTSRACRCVDIRLNRHSLVQRS